MANQPLPPTPADTTPTPPLLALPVELKLHILSYLSVKKPFLSPGQNILSLMILRRTHRSFREIIPHAPYASVVRPSKLFLLLEAEINHPYLFPPNHYPCYGCLWLIEGSGFGRCDTPAWDCDLEPHAVPPLQSKKAAGRRCNACWDSVFDYNSRRRIS